MAQAVPGEGPGTVPPCSLCLQVETLASLKALGRYVDSSQLTPELDGTFPYCHGEWVQFFQVSVTALLAIASPPHPAPPSPRHLRGSQPSLEKQQESPGEGTEKETSEQRATPSCLLVPAPAHPLPCSLPPRL